jgi:hypothetical protein
MVKVTVLVEGGGDDNSLKSRAAAGLRKLIEKLGLKNRPAIEFLGGRDEVYKRFCREVDRPREPRLYLLLVDSEEEVPYATNDHPRWHHLASRDKWQRPSANVTDAHLHFMVTAMETWIVADKNAIRDRFPADYRDVISDGTRFESLSKSTVLDLLQRATNRNEREGRYKKGVISFELLARVNPDTLRKNCPHAHRFFEELERHLG